MVRGLVVDAVRAVVLQSGKLPVFRFGRILAAVAARVGVIHALDQRELGHFHLNHRSAVGRALLVTDLFLTVDVGDHLVEHVRLILSIGEEAQFIGTGLVPLSISIVITGIRIVAGMLDEILVRLIGRLD